MRPTWPRIRGTSLLQIFFKQRFIIRDVFDMIHVPDDRVIVTVKIELFGAETDELNANSNEKTG